MKFKLEKVSNPKPRGQNFYYTLVGDNGEVMMVSETMYKKASLLKSIKAIKGNINPSTEVLDNIK